MDKRNVVLTGVPRSGTSLVCSQLNKLPDTVALVEPIGPGQLKRYPDEESRCDAIQEFFTRTRETLLADGEAISLQQSGRIVDNNFGPPNRRGVRRQVAVRDVVKIDKPLSADFTLCVKHPAFTLMLEPLLCRFPCFAIVRNPMRVLWSWTTCGLHRFEGSDGSNGFMDPRLREALAGLPEPLDRQIHLLSWFYEQYRALLRPEAIVRYEDVVSSGGSALRVITGEAAGLREPMTPREPAATDDRDLLRTVGRRLLDSDGAYWHFYPRASVESLL